jgi:isoaspartyl peptidase/L-asparaginase-like protein (Ntn-hydrolase superfamily)
VALTAGAIHALARGERPEAAARAAIETMARRTAASGGLIIIDRAGRMGFARSTRTMTWAAAWDGGSDAGA